MHAKIAPQPHSHIGAVARDFRRYAAAGQSPLRPSQYRPCRRRPRRHGEHNSHAAFHAACGSSRKYRASGFMARHRLSSAASTQGPAAPQSPFYASSITWIDDHPRKRNRCRVVTAHSLSWQPDANYFSLADWRQQFVAPQCLPCHLPDLEFNRVSVDDHGTLAVNCMQRFADRRVVLPGAVGRL